MDWEQIKQIEKNSYVYIGNHSHSHDYLVNFSPEKLIKDIDTANKTFIKKNTIYL